MTTPALPATGQVNWGGPLNSYISQVVMATANLAEQTITAHQVASDPHGDRAYALSLVQPLTSGLNKPGGLLQLDSTGRVPSALAPAGGGRSSTFDVIKDYGAPVNGVTDAAPAIQKALNDAATAGGGEVWVGDGSFALGSTLVIGANTWLHLSPGTVMQRIAGSSGTVPSQMLVNYTSTSTAGNGNVMVTGGEWNFASQTLTGQPLAFAAGTFVQLSDIAIVMLPGCPGIVVAGCTSVSIDNVMFTAAAPANARSSYTSGPPAIRVESVASTVLPGLPPAWTSSSSGSAYYQKACSAVDIQSCAILAQTAADSSGLFSVVNGIAGTYTPVASSYHSVAVTHCYAPALPGNGVSAVNWVQQMITGNMFLVTGSGVPVATSWNPSAAPAVAWIVNSENAPPAVPDTWHSLAPMNTGYGIPSGGFAMYRMTSDNTVRLSFSISTTNKSNVVGFNQIVKTALPAAYRPKSNHYFAIGTNNLALWGAGSTPNNESAQAVGQLSSNGFVYVFGVAADADVIYFDVEIPLDV